MSRLWLVILILSVLVVVTAAAFLYMWDIPAPQEHVEQTLSVDRDGR